MLEYVCSLKLKSGQVEHTATRKYSIQASVLMFLVDQHTQLKCVFKDLEIESEKKSYVYFSQVSALHANMWDVWSEHNGGILGATGVREQVRSKIYIF